MNTGMSPTLRASSGSERAAMGIAAVNRSGWRPAMYHVPRPPML